jgi:hypothetical protein
MDDSTTPQPLHPDPEIAASLEFEPVPRKLERVGGWNAEAQRAFIAALAMTGSPRRAAHAVGMRTAGVEKLRETEGGESFAAAWGRAVEIASATRTGRLRQTLDRLQSPAVQSAGGPDHAPQGPRADPLPVICDTCRAEGAAGDEAFSAIPDILAFDPVPRSAHDQLWPAETQRAFIAALAVSGSPVRAARSVGRHAFGAEKLRKGRGARSFSEAWEAALDLARERELSRLHGKLDQLTSPAIDGEADRDGQVINEFGEYEDAASYERRGEEARKSIFEKLQRMRRTMLRDEIIPDPEKRTAWIVLNGPEEIEAIERGEWKPAEWRKPEDREGD